MGNGEIYKHWGIIKDSEKKGLGIQKCTICGMQENIRKCKKNDIAWWLSNLLALGTTLL